MSKSAPGRWESRGRPAREGLKKTGPEILCRAAETLDIAPNLQCSGNIHVVLNLRVSSSTECLVLSGPEGINLAAVDRRSWLRNRMDALTVTAEA